MMKGLKCKECARCKKGVPEHIRLICDAANFRHELPEEAHPYFDYWIDYLMHIPERQRKDILNTL